MKINQIRELHGRVIVRLRSLQEREEIMALLLFGSAARGDLGEHSDIDAIFIVRDGLGSRHLLHRYIEGIKVDVSFNTFEQFEELTREQIAAGERVPMICESRVLFDKDGRLERYKASLVGITPRSLSENERKFQVFIVVHLDTKVSRFMEDDDLVQAEVVMHYALSDLMKRHYRLQRKWRVSDKRLLGDLKNWDGLMADLVREFVSEKETRGKFEIWKRMVARVLGEVNISGVESTNCACDLCVSNLRKLD